MLRYERLRLAVEGFFDSVGTVLDCLAAVLIVVARVPLSVQRADHAQLTGLDPTRAFANAFTTSPRQTQRDLWRALLDEIADAATAGTTDWLPWSLEMRNALTHRGRITTVFLPRRISGRLLVPPTDDPQANYRYDPHLRRRPWLPGLEQMLAGPALQDSWLDEPASRTVGALRGDLRDYCERLSRWAHLQWTASWQGELSSPVHKWMLPPQPHVAFQGAAPGGTTPIAGATGGINQQYMCLAERLRRRRAGLPDLGDRSGTPSAY